MQCMVLSLSIKMHCQLLIASNAYHIKENKSRTASQEEGTVLSNFHTCTVCIDSCTRTKEFVFYVIRTISIRDLKSVSAFYLDIVIRDRPSLRAALHIQGCERLWIV